MGHLSQEEKISVLGKNPVLGDFFHLNEYK
jgi:hypothetical protein